MKLFGTYPTINIFSSTSFNHKGCNENTIATISFVECGNNDIALAKRCEHFGLYTIMTSYAKNNNNHLTIDSKSFGLLTMYTSAIWSTKNVNLLLNR